MDDMNRIPPPHCTKVFVQRDYTDGTIVRFSTKFLPELEGKIEKSQFEHAVTQINNIYLEAESLNSRTYCESCMACLTAYLSYLCMDTYYEKCIKKGSRFIEEQNNTIWVPKGLMLIDPAERGLRILEICILNESTR
ncbi:golgin subfamily A member 7-like isoform X2 [Lineus longissimus]